MPKTKRKQGRKIKKRARGVPRTTLGSQVVPPSRRTVLTYETVVTLSPSSVTAQYTFRGNGLYDPDYTSSGHQPYGYDQMTPWYDKYRVYASSIRVQIINGSPTAGVMCVVLPATDIPTFTSWPVFAEMPFSKTTDIVPIASRYGLKVSHGISTSKVLGLRSRQIMDEDYAAATSGNPNSVWYWNVGVASIDETTHVQVSLRVRLEYTAVFYDRITPGLSAKIDPSTYQNPKSQPFETFNNVVPVQPTLRRTLSA